jgi:hypothetical protein
MSKFHQPTFPKAPDQTKRALRANALVNNRFRKVDILEGDKQSRFHNICKCCRKQHIGVCDILHQTLIFH